MAIDQSSRPKRPESDDPEKDSGPKECNWRLKLWLDSLPPGGTFSVVSPGDDGYEQAKKRSATSATRRANALTHPPEELTLVVPEAPRVRRTLP